nr:transcription factor MYC2 [Allium sativum]
MNSPEMSSWEFDYPLIDNISIAAADFGVAGNGLLWPPQGLSNSAVVSIGNSSNIGDFSGMKENVSKKRARSESSKVATSKASKEKMRRNRLNDKFVELGSVLEPGNPKTDKAAILSDAVRLVSQLRSEAQKLKDSSDSLHEKIKELKDEKNELRDEKQRLKQEKEVIEQQIKALSHGHGPKFMAPVIPTAFASPQVRDGGHKMMMPMMSYHGYPMWQFMPPADTDTSQDVESCPPVA